MANIIKQLKDANGNNIYPVAYTPPITFDLLWTNTNTSGQGAGSANVNLANYDMAGIVCLRYQGYTTETTWDYCPIGKAVLCTNADGHRLFTVGTTSVSWNAGNQNYFVIPYQIYGIKI